MAKYYIQSGNINFVVGACDAEGAALWTMHRIMDEKICDHEDALNEGHQLESELDFFNMPVSHQAFDNEVPQAIPYEAMLDGLAQFEEKILVSERGFGHHDAGQLGTEDIFHQWRQLMLAVDRLHDHL